MLNEFSVHCRILYSVERQTAVAANLCDQAWEMNIPVLLITGSSILKELKKARFYTQRTIQIKSTEKEMIIENVKCSNNCNKQ